MSNFSPFFELLTEFLHIFTALADSDLTVIVVALVLLFMVTIVAGLTNSKLATIIVVFFSLTILAAYIVAKLTK